MFHKYSIKYLLLEEADLGNLKTDMLHYQGRITEIFSIIYLKSPSINPADFVPSKNLIKKPVPHPTTLPTLNTPPKPAPPLPFESLQGGGPSEGDWKQELRNIYKNMSERKDLKEIDALFLQYFEEANNLAIFIKNYMASSKQTIVSYEWRGNKPKEEGKENTGDVKLITDTYPGGVWLSLKSSITSRTSMFPTQTQSLGLYEDYNIDTTSDAREAVTPLMAQYAEERRIWISNKKLEMEEERGAFAGLSDMIRKESEQDREISKWIDRQENLKNTKKNLAKLVKTPRDENNRSQRDSEYSLWKSWEGRRRSREEIMSDPEYKEELYAIGKQFAEIKKQKEAELRKVSDELKDLQKKIRAQEKKIEKDIKARLFKSAARTDGWNLKDTNFIPNDPTSLVLRAPFFEADGDYKVDGRKGAKDSWFDTIEDIATVKNQTQVLRVLSNPSMLNILIEKFIRRQLPPQGLGESLHLVFHSKKGLIPKSDMDFLKEFLRNEKGLSVDRKGRNSKTFSVYGKDFSDHTWLVMTIEYIGNGWGGFTRPGFKVTPRLEMRE